MKDPQNYLPKFVSDLRCPVFPERPAELKPAMRVWVNHESWFVSGSEARQKFIDDPLAWITTVTDPVDELRFRPTPESPRFDFQGRPYFFRSAATHDAFVGNPPRYAEPRRAMKKPMAG